MIDFILDFLELIVEFIFLFGTKTFNIICLIISIFLIIYVSPYFIILSLLNIVILIILWRWN
jgi:hypothetical protein